jgi:small subunit ribosomal protein S6
VKRDYDLGVIFSPEVTEEETRSILDRIEQIVADHGGQVVRVNQWGRRRLAYPIERHRDGLYVFIDLILTPETVAEIERMLKVSEILLRYMFVRRDPKAAQKEREEREARAAAAAAAPAEEPVVEETAQAETTEAEAAPVAEETETVSAEEAPATPVAEESTAPEAPEASEAPATTSAETTVEA